MRKQKDKEKGDTMEFGSLNGKPAIPMPIQSELNSNLGIKFKSSNNYGIEIVGQVLTTDYVEWHISFDEIVQCLKVMVGNGIVTQQDIQETYACVANHRWQFIIDTLQYRMNQQYPYLSYPNHSPGIPFPSIPDTYLMECIFFKFPTSSFYSARMYPFWVEVSLEKMGEASFYLCFPLGILKNANIESPLRIENMGQFNEAICLVLDNSTTYPILETCSVAGRMSFNHRKTILQLLGQFLPPQSQ